MKKKIFLVLAVVAMCAYVIDGDTVSYMQAGGPEENEKYYFASYNEVLDLVSSK